MASLPQSHYWLLCINSTSGVVTAILNVPAVGGRKCARVSSCEGEEYRECRDAHFESVDIEVSIDSL